MSDRAQFTETVAGRITAWRRTAFLIGGDWARAEDQVQTVLLRMYRRWSRIDPASVEGYVRTALVRLAVDEVRSARRRFEVAGPLPERAVEPPDHAALTDLRAALAGLPPRQRATLVLRYHLDLSVEDTAAALGVSTGTVKSQTARALTNLRTALDPVGAGRRTADQRRTS